MFFPDTPMPNYPQNLRSLLSEAYLNHPDYSCEPPFPPLLTLLSLLDLPAYYIIYD